MAGALGLTVAALNELPDKSVVLDGQSNAWQKDTDGDWASFGEDYFTGRELRQDRRPLVLLFDPRTSRHAPVVGQMVLTPEPKRRRRG